MDFVQVITTVQAAFLLLTCMSALKLPANKFWSAVGFTAGLTIPFGRVWGWW